MIYPLVVIHWNDAVSESNWRETDTASETSPAKCISVGFLLATFPNVIIAASISDNDTVGDTLLVPAGWVSSIVTIDELDVPECFN